MLKKSFTLMVGLVLLVACGSNETETVETTAPSVNTNTTVTTDANYNVPNADVNVTNNTDSSSYTSNSSTTGSTGMTAGSNNPMLANARPGECYAQIVRPPKYENKTEKVLATAESFKIKTLPPVYKTVTKTVTTKEASTKIVPVPATYKTVTETVVVTPASTKLVPVPAQYKTVTKKIEVAPATQVWKKGTNGTSGAAAAGQGQYGANEADGHVQNDILCLVNVPAKYKTVKEKVVVSPATTKTVNIPAVTKQVTKKVVDRPASTKTVNIPAITKTINVKELVEPAREVKTPIPATYKTITKRVMVDPGQTTWGRILCKTNQQSSIVKAVQGKVGTTQDGILGPGTYRAVRRYQERNGLAVGGITYETLSHMGINM